MTRQNATGDDPAPTAATWRVGLLTCGLALFGAAIILLGDNADEGSRAYTSTPQFKVWAAIIVGILASLPAVGQIGIDLLGRLGLTPRRVLRSKAVLVAMAVDLLVIAGAVAGGAYARGSSSPYFDGLARLGVIYLLGVTAATPAFLAMWECYRQLGARHGGHHADHDVTCLLLIRECLLTALTTVGLLVSAGVLATGAQREAALADHRYSDPYPAAYVLIWGMAFSGLLLVNFLPAFRRLTRNAKAAIDAILPILPPGTDKWQARLQERRDLADLLKVTSDAKDVIISSVLVAGPLLSSALSMFLPTSSK